VCFGSRTLPSKLLSSDITIPEYRAPANVLASSYAPKVFYTKDGVKVPAGSVLTSYVAPKPYYTKSGVKMVPIILQPAYPPAH
jgi:hypothetical protein